MSHFTVMIIGDNPEGQLEPFSEHIEVDPYSTGIVTEEDKQSMVEYYIEQNTAEYKGKSFEVINKLHGHEWNNNSYKKNDQGVWEEYSTYNPKSKWDWYQLGGRWSGAILKLKEGATGHTGEPGAFKNDVGVDAALKGDIDFAGMKDDAEKEARKEYLKVLNVFDGVIPVLDHIWVDMIDEKNEEYNTLSIDDRRAMYHGQPALLKVNEKREELGHWFELDKFQCSEDEFALRARENACSTFAILKDGVWYEKGNMGWFAMVSNEKDNWNEETQNLLGGVSDDTLISIYDCHI